jgi:CBS domain-containing protein
MATARASDTRGVELTVADAMVTHPAVHPPWTTVGEVRAHFEDEHVHMTLIVHAGKLLGLVERSDLAATTDDGSPALAVARLDGRTLAPEVPLAEAREVMREAGLRRLAVTTGDSTLVGLLCLKASGRGFCSDDDVAARRQGARSSGQITTSSRPA